MNLEIKDGDTVFDVLVKATRKKGIHMEYTGSGTSAYIEGIDNLYEFDAGDESGWRYTVNGKNVNYGCGTYKVKDNDVIKECDDELRKHILNVKDLHLKGIHGYLCSGRRNGGNRNLHD